MQIGMSGSATGLVLKRRVEAILRRPTRHTRSSTVALASAAVAAFMFMAAHAFTAPIHDRRVSAAEATEMADIARAGGGIAVEMNARVLAQLNLLVATPDGRAFLQKSLLRMREFEPFLSEQIRLRGLPPELLAVPLVESGYRNLPPDGNPRHGAGLWMFVTPTAKRFGLTVEGETDDRLNVAAETRAALELFESLYAHFGSWELALLGYNAGSAKVEQGIRETGSNDAWDLVDKGYQNDADYLSRVMAVMLIMKNPTVLQTL